MAPDVTVETYLPCPDGELASLVARFRGLLDGLGYTGRDDSSGKKGWAGTTRMGGLARPPIVLARCAASPSLARSCRRGRACWVGRGQRCGADGPLVELRAGV